MAKRVGCARKICRAELEEVPPNAMAGNVMVEMPSVVARVGTVNVPTYGLRATGCTCSDLRATPTAKRVLCARKTRREELEDVPPNAATGQVVFEMPSVVARVGTAGVPTYGLLLLARFFWLLPWCALCSSFVFTQIAAFASCHIALGFGFMVLFAQPLHIFGLVFAAVHQRLFMVDLIPGASTLLFSRSRARVRFAKLIFLLRISWQGKRH